MVTPYLHFAGCCAEAVAFYERVFDGKNKTVLLYDDYIPRGQTVTEDISRYILHAEMEINGANFWFADETGPLIRGNTLDLTVYYPTAEECQKMYDALSEGGETILPPGPQYYTPFHGAVRDKFGVGWHILFAGNKD